MSLLWFEVRVIGLNEENVFKGIGEFARREGRV
jgi:hypothetical protein